MIKDEILARKNTAQDDELKAPSPSRCDTPPRRGIVKFIPPLRGDSRGVCLFYFTFFIILKRLNPRGFIIQSFRIMTYFNSLVRA
jgi:hypothetical protein